MITLCSTDDRYADDVHYRGGAVLALEMLSWGTSMLSFNAMAPDPEVYGEAGATPGSSASTGWSLRARVDVAPAP